MNALSTRLLLIMAIAMVGHTADSAEAAVDEILERSHRLEGISPTPICDDLTFLRRASLDLIGRVPTAKEVAAFEASPDRSRLIEQLLSSDEFPRYWSQLWSTILIGRGERQPANREALRRWLESEFAAGKPLDQIAFDLISAQGVTALDGQVNFIVGNREDPVTPVSRIFLGVQLDCARCHDHPFDRWSQEDYHAMRKFFQPLQVREVSGGVSVTDRGAAAGSGEESPRFLTGARPRTGAWRRELALMTVRCKPFARAMGNRIWQLLLGRGIVDPVDGLSQSSTASVPELHQALADQLRDQNFDLRQLIKTICNSDAYSRTEYSKNPEIAEDHDRYREANQLFAARRPRPLIPEQLIASYSMIVDRELQNPAELSVAAVEFLGRSAAVSGASDPLALQRTSQGLLQELAAQSTTPKGSLDSIFLSTLTRRPDDWERRAMERTSGIDVLYALLHCNEFVFSH